MAIQRAHLGLFGQSLPCDQDGFVATIDDGPWDLSLHHDEPTHDAAGALTGYGLWWFTIGWADYQARAIEAAAAAQAQLSEWRRKPTSQKI